MDLIPHWTAMTADAWRTTSPTSTDPMFWDSAAVFGDGKDERRNPACALRSRITATLTCLLFSAPPPPTELAPVLCVSAPPPRGTWTRALASLPPPPASGRREGRPAAPSGAFDLTTSDFPGSSAQAFTLQVFLKGKKKGQKVAALVSECCTKENNRETGIS